MKPTVNTLLLALIVGLAVGAVWFLFAALWASEFMSYSEKMGFTGLYLVVLGVAVSALRVGRS